MESKQPDGNSSHLERTMSRRQLITYLLGFSVVATLGGVLTPIIGYLWPPSRAAGGSSGRVQVGTSLDFPVGQGKVVPVNDKPVIVVNTPRHLHTFGMYCRVGPGAAIHPLSVPRRAF